MRLTQAKRGLIQTLRNERGVALISVYVVSVMLAGISAATFSRALAQSRMVDREQYRLQSFAAAEAGLQSAMAQIGQNAYTGFINTASISNSNFQSVYGNAVGSVDVTMEYPNSADWVIVHATATTNGETQQLEGRVFLNSNLSKYLIYSDTSTLALGNNLVLGESNGTDPQGVAADPNERAATYHTNNLDFSGTNIHIYGDVHAENLIDGSLNSYVHGDTYVGSFALNSNGTVYNDGINGNLTVTDGFADDIDRNNDGAFTSADALDNHDLTVAGGGDAHKVEPLDDVNTTFYKNNKDTSVPSTWGTTTTTRYIELVPSSDGSKTKVIEYTNSTYATQSTSFTLSNANAILYNNGSLYVKSGEVSGRVSVVSGNDIVFDGNVKYKNGQSYVSSANSAAFIAKDQVFFRPTDLEVSGIVYARKQASTGSLAVDSNYNTAGVYDPGAKYDGHFRLYGNIIMNGTANTANYQTDRAYVYDPNIKYYRPPGIPVVPELRTIVEE